MLFLKIHSRKVNQTCSSCLPIDNVINMAGIDEAEIQSLRLNVSYGGETVCASTKIFFSDKRKVRWNNPTKVVNNMAQYYTTSDIPVVLKLAQEIRVVLAESHE